MGLIYFTNKCFIKMATSWLYCVFLSEKHMVGSQKFPVGTTATQRINVSNAAHRVAEEIVKAYR